jgi:hypothetical protein
MDKYIKEKVAVGIFFVAASKFQTMAWGSARPHYTDGDEGKKELGWGPQRREQRSMTTESWKGS